MSDHVEADRELIAAIREVLGPPLSPEQQAEWDERYRWRDAAEPDDDDFRARVAKAEDKDGEAQVERPQVEGSLRERSTRAFSIRDAPSTRDRPPTRDEEKAAWLRSLPITSWKVVSRAAGLGRTGRLAEPEFVTWKLRVAVEEGILTPAPVEAAPLPDGYDEATRAVYDGFVFLLACKWLYERDRPTVFSREFAAPWCGVSMRQARDAITVLKRDGFLVPDGKYGRSTLWWPGRGK